VLLESFGESGFKLKKCEDLYFVFLGKKLPKYVVPSLDLAVKHSGMRISLIGDEVLKDSFTHSPINFISTGTFYDNTEFLQTSKNLLNNHSYRDGFWLKTLERFFVIEQFMMHQNIYSLLHAELDQLLFGINDLDERLKNLKDDGFYVPLHNKEEAIASLIYIRNPAVLSSLLKYARSAVFQNEMRLISNWGNENPQMVFGFPTLASELNMNDKLREIKIIQSKTLDGIFDAAQLGQWVAGIDPKNVQISKKPNSRFVDVGNSSNLKLEQLNDLSFLFEEESNKLFVRYLNQTPTRIYNLHIHAKIHPNLLKAKPSIEELFSSVNKGEVISFTGARSIQLYTFFKFRFINLMKDPRKIVFRFARLIKSYFKIRSSSEPFISGDTFRKNADLVWEKSYPQFELNNVRSNFVIFCESDCVFDLNEKILSKLTVPVTLILGNSDQNHDTTYLSLTSNVNIKKIFAQNLETSLNGFCPLPIGLENLWRSNHGKTSKYKKLMKVSKSRKSRIMWTFTIDTNPVIRSKAALELSNVKVADRFGIVSSNEHRELLLSYSFIASPPGNGLDTHRTWEAMYLGCVPIVLRSYMTDYYASLGLPMWVVDSYKDVELLNEEQLAAKYEDFRPSFQNKALWFDFWKKQITS